jgi:hypothetical protein
MCRLLGRYAWVRRESENLHQSVSSSEDLLCRILLSQYYPSGAANGSVTMSPWMAILTCILSEALSFFSVLVRKSLRAFIDLDLGWIARGYTIMWTRYLHLRKYLWVLVRYARPPPCNGRYLVMVPDYQHHRPRQCVGVCVIHSVYTPLWSMTEIHFTPILRGVTLTHPPSPPLGEMYEPWLLPPIYPPQHRPSYSPSHHAGWY